VRLRFDNAFPEINGFSAPRTGVGAIEFIGKDLLFLPALGAPADKGAQIAQVLETGTVHRCGRVLGHCTSSDYLFIPKKSYFRRLKKEMGSSTTFGV
jgi:hypothetical protein